MCNSTFPGNHSTLIIFNSLLLSVQPPLSYDEKFLLQQIAGGDEQAFRTIFEKYKNKVYGFAFHYTRSVVQSEEIVQEIFLKVWVKKETLPQIENFEGWLYITTRNLSLNTLKKIAYDYSYRGTLAAEPRARSLEDELILKDLHELVRKAVEELPPQQK